MQLLKRALAIGLALLTVALSMVGCFQQNKQEQRVVGTCAGYEIKYEELRYLTLTYKEIFESTYGQGIWDDPVTAEKYRAELEETVFRLLLNNYAVLAAGDYYLPQKNAIQNDSIQEAVDQMIDEMIAEYDSKKEFREELKKMYATESLLRFTSGVNQVQNELMYALSNDWQLIYNDTDKFYDWLMEGNCVYVQHVFIENDPGEDPEENRAIAEQVRLDLLTGAKTIGQLVGSAINEDTQNVAPYFVVREVYKPVIEEAVFPLAFAGDVSYVAESESGYYVFVWMDFNEATLLARINTLLSEYQAAKTDAVVEEFKADLTIEWNEYGKSLDLLAIT